MCCRGCAGAFCLVFMDETTLYAARDPQGIRPLVLGRLERGWVVASETAALDIVGASFVREVEPGELIAIDEHGLRTQRFAPADPKGCLFEYVYLARPDTTIAGRGVHDARVEIGRRLAHRGAGRGRPGHPGARVRHAGRDRLRQGSGIPYGQGLVKNAYVGRTFIQPSQTIRQLGIRLKLNPLRDVIHGKRLVVVDDSIVRGNTQRALIRMLREAGAAEVHVRISSPPVKWPCFYGIDFASRAELIANGLGVDEIRQSHRRGLAGVHLARGARRRHRAARWTGCAAPASTGSTRSSCPTPTCSASTCSRGSSGARSSRAARRDGRPTRTRDPRRRRAHHPAGRRRGGRRPAPGREAPPMTELVRGESAGTAPRTPRPGSTSRRVSAPSR